MPATKKATVPNTLKKPGAKKTSATKTGAKKAASPTRASGGAADRRAVFDALRAILARTTKGLAIKKDTGEAYYVDSSVPYRKKTLFYGAVVNGKSYVSYHYFPVYMFPELLEGMSPALAKRMQGKACFNFTAIDEDVLAELARLTDAGIDRFRRESLV